MSERSKYLWPFRIAIGLYVLAVVILVGGAIAVSTKEVPVSAYMQAPKTFRSGQLNAARGIVLDGETGRHLIGAKVALRKGESTFASGQTEPHGHVHLQFEPGPEVEGDVELVARHGALDEPYVVGARVDVEPPLSEFEWPEATSRVSEPWDAPDEPFDGPLHVELFPGTDVARGLPDQVVLRVTDAVSGAPVRAEVTLKEIEGMLAEELTKKHRTDPFGLVRIELTAMTRQAWTLEARRADDPLAPASTGQVGFDTAPAQYSLKMLQPFAVPGDVVSGAVYSLHRSGGIMVDLYEPDDWVAAAAFGLGPDRSGVQVQVPERPQTPFYRVQVYGNIFGIDNAWDADYVASAPEPGLTGCRIALERTLAELATNEPDRWERWVEAARPQLREIGTVRACAQMLDAILVAIPRHFTPPNLLVNSQRDERAKLEIWKEEARAELIFLLTFVLIGGLAFIAFLALRGLASRRSQRAAIDAVDLEFDEDENERLPSQFEEYLDYARIAIILVSLVAFVFALLMLLGGL